MKPNAGKEAFTKAAAMARHMDETYDKTEKLVQQAKLYAETAKDSREKIARIYQGMTDANKAEYEKMARQFQSMADDVIDSAEKFNAVAARSFLALTLANAVLCAGAIALSYYLMR